MNKELQSVNFSLRTRESHLIGSKTLDKGEINFVEGILVKSMKDGSLLYLDELNAEKLMYCLDWTKHLMIGDKWCSRKQMVRLLPQGKIGQ